MEDLQVSICQMKVVPGRPDLNSKYMIAEILSAIKRGVDIIVFPEMCVSGYLIGDLWEDESFVKDVLLFNERVCCATRGGIVAIFGSVMTDEPGRGKDGRTRKLNVGIVAQNGKMLGWTTKSLQPNYRVFDDDRHFFSTCDIVSEKSELLRILGSHGDSSCLGIHSHLTPFSVEIRFQKRLIGVTLCEDMWHQDYPFNPTESLVENGAQIIFNLSASPWTWQKSRKRHQVVKDLISVCRVPFVYVNNTGVQNNGKNIIIFDGGSTVYNENGDIAFQAKPYENDVYDVEIKRFMPRIFPVKQDDQSELYMALRCAGREFFETLPSVMRKVVIGVSGGIDSALVAALYTDILGSENVIAINMPSKFNSEITKDAAFLLAKNLGVRYEICPIQEIVDLVAKTAGVKEDSLTYENIQARVRMEILAAKAQEIGCVFSANWNKVEAAFGYGTLYGDMAGFMAIIGDLIKIEVYQLADYMNRVVFGREVIPGICFEIEPTAGLRENQKDPFDYGNLKRRGYHDEIVRAFTQFRRNPEWVLEKYLGGDLEKELQLEPGMLERLFPDSSDFIEDLEKCWKMFFNSYFKRVQSAPIPIVSKRAFGNDLRESMVSSHLTVGYQNYKQLILFNERRNLFGEKT